MRAVIQRVKCASVTVDNQVISSINEGLCVLLGINREDVESSVEPLIKKLMTMKLFNETSKDNQTRGAPWKESLSSNTRENGLELLLVSQFTLDAYFKGAKPDFHKAMGGDKAESMFNSALATAIKLHPKGETHVKTGQFGADMQVDIRNDGPVTIIYDYPQTVNRDGNAVAKADQAVSNSQPVKKEKKQKVKMTKEQNLAAKAAREKREAEKKMAEEAILAEKVEEVKVDN